MGSRKGIYLIPDQTTSLAECPGHRFTALFPCAFLLFFPSSLQTHPPYLALEGKAASVWVGSGKSPALFPPRPCRVTWYMQTMTSLLSFIWTFIWYLAQSHTLFHPAFCWVQPYSLADPIEISGPSCGVRSWSAWCTHCLVCIKLLWWEPQRWTRKQYS